MDGFGVSFAQPILTRAVTLDGDGRYTESLVCYQEGIQILLEALKNIPEEEKKVKIRNKTKEYMARAEKVKDHIEALKSTGKYREQIQVAEDAIGFSYRSVFSRFLDDMVVTIQIDDPYIRSPHQCDNLVRFLELAVQSCPKLNAVRVCTGKDNANYGDQAKRLETIKRSLQIIPSRKEAAVQFEINYSESLHDREIRLDNGWVIKIGRGLDFFKPLDRFHVGFSDFDLRPCRTTTIDVFHRKDLQKIH